MKRTDIFIILIIVIFCCIAGLVYLKPQPDTLEVIISLNGEEYARVPLNEDDYSFDIKTDWGYNKVIVTNEGVSIIEADCPDHDCENIGVIKHAGQSIICAPHRLVVEIKGKQIDELDDIAI